MINWFDMPAEGLSNGGLFEVKELEVTENGTYETKGEMYNKVTVNVEGGGGSSTSYITLFEGSVTTTVQEHAIEAEIPMDYEVTATAEVPMRVTFQGNTYMTTKGEWGDFGAPIDPDTGDPDFSTFPFGGGFNGDIIILDTETAGTYQVKIEIQEYIQIRTVNEA